MRRKAKIDNNQTAIVNALLGIPGVTVEVGHDDILVGRNGSTYWYELKSDLAVSKKTGLILESQKKNRQKKLEKEFTGHYRIVSSLDEIISEITEVRQ